MFKIILIAVLALPFMGYCTDKVALLFLTVKDINQSQIWKEQLENDSRFSIYIHSKEKMKDHYFSKHRIKKIVPTSWAYHVYAWQELIKIAVKDPQNKKFILVSESCLPLMPLNEIYDFLIQDENSYMTFTRPFWPNRHNREVIELPKEHRWVGSEWIILNRSHANLVAQDKDIIKVVSRHGSDAESYFPSLLSYHGMLFDEDVLQIPTTYTNWKLGHDSHPYTFEDASPMNLQLLKEARNANYLFVRKIGKSFPSDVLKSIILSE